MPLPTLFPRRVLLSGWLTWGKEASIKDSLFEDGQSASREVSVHSCSPVCAVAVSKNNLDGRFYGKIQTSGVINYL